MKRTFLLSAALVASTGLMAAGQTVTAVKTAYNGADIRKMTREAHTVDQYTALTQYYAARQRMFEQKAAEEMHLWAQRAEMVTPLSEKWPRPVDSARNLHDYYEYKAAQAAGLAAKYDKLADAAAR